MAGIFDSIDLAPRRTAERPFTEAHKFSASNRYPQAHLVIETRNSVYEFDIEGGPWRTEYTLVETTNADIPRCGEVEFPQYLNEALMDALYSEERMPNFSKLEGHHLTFAVMKKHGYYEPAEADFAWQITTIRSAKLLAGLTYR